MNIDLVLSSFNDFLMGVSDSFKIFSVFNVIKQSSKITNNIKNCVILNGLLFIGSMILYFYLIEPIIQKVFTVGRFQYLYYLAIIGKYVYYTFWLIPVYLICNVITGFWIDEIYYESLSIMQNTQIKIQGQSIITNLANQIERLIIVLSFVTFLSIINFFSFLPGIFILKYVTLSILNSLYVFEYILLQNYIRDYKSIMYFIEHKFFYFLGYGVLLTILINIISSVTINSSIFLMAFPFFIINSIQISQLRFNQTTEIKHSKLLFFFFINKFYEFGLTITNLLFYCYKNGIKQGIRYTINKIDTQSITVLSSGSKTNLEEK